MEDKRNRAGVEVRMLEVERLLVERRGGSESTTKSLKAKSLRKHADREGKTQGDTRPPFRDQNRAVYYIHIRPA